MAVTHQVPDKTNEIEGHLEGGGRNGVTVSGCTQKGVTLALYIATQRSCLVCAVQYSHRSPRKVPVTGTSTPKIGFVLYKSTKFIVVG